MAVTIKNKKEENLKKIGWTEQFLCAAFFLDGATLSNDFLFLW